MTKLKTGYFRKTNHFKTLKITIAQWGEKGILLLKNYTQMNYFGKQKIKPRIIQIELDFLFSKLIMFHFYLKYFRSYVSAYETNFTFI